MSMSNNLNFSTIGLSRESCDTLQADGAKKWRLVTDLSDDVDDTLVDAGVGADLQERVGPKPGLEEGYKGRSLFEKVLKINRHR